MKDVVRDAMLPPALTERRGRGWTLTSGDALPYTEVQGEVSVQQWGTILVHNVPGRYAPEMTQSPLLEKK